MSLGVFKGTAFTALLAWALLAHALPPVPAGPQQEPVALVGATVHVGDGTVIENATVTFAEGVITGVGQALDSSGHRTLDVSGQHLYPGFILPDSVAGLEEVSSIDDTIDTTETGRINPSVRSLIAYNTDSEMIPTLRFNGVLVAQVAPTGGLVSGTSSIVHFDAWNWEDAALEADDGLFMSWPAKRTGRFDFSTFSFEFEENENYDSEVAELEALFRDAGTYDPAREGTERNLKLEAVRAVIDGERRLYVRSNVATDVVRAADFARRHGVQHVVIVGADGLLDAAEYLAERDIPVIVNGLHRLPRHAHDAVDAPYTLPARLLEAGVRVGLTYPSLMSSRNLGFIAGTAAAYGVDREQALRLITLSNAEILAIDDRVGSIEVGKEATLFVSRGDALDVRGNDLSHAFIEGREITLPGTQQELYRRYREKYAAR